MHPAPTATTFGTPPRYCLPAWNFDFSNSRSIKCTVGFIPHSNSLCEECIPAGSACFEEGSQCSRLCAQVDEQWAAAEAAAQYWGGDSVAGYYQDGHADAYPHAGGSYSDSANFGGTHTPRGGSEHSGGQIRRAVAVPAQPRRVKEKKRRCTASTPFCISASMAFGLLLRLQSLQFCRLKSTP